MSWCSSFPCISKGCFLSCLDGFSFLKWFPLSKLFGKRLLKLLRLFQYLKLLFCFLIKLWNKKNKCPKIDPWWPLSVKTLSSPVCEIWVKHFYRFIRKPMHFILSNKVVSKMSKTLRRSIKIMRYVFLSENLLKSCQLSEIDMNLWNGFLLSLIGNCLRHHFHIIWLCCLKNIAELFSGDQ